MQDGVGGRSVLVNREVTQRSLEHMFRINQLITVMGGGGGGGSDSVSWWVLLLHN